MKRFLLFIALFALTVPANAQLDRILRGLGSNTKTDLSDGKVVSGLKEALQIGTENSVKLTGRKDGYFGNEAIRILMPDKLRTVEKGLRAVGMGGQVDEFILSMNRAAETAAPKAKQIFWDALREMTFDDARKILTGGDTAATEYFKAKTSDRLTTAFRPEVETAMQEVGVTRQYEQLMGRAKAIPFMKTQAVDINSYVVAKSLDGLFFVLGQEEQKIRKNPAARVTPLLKEVFGR